MRNALELKFLPQAASWVVSTAPFSAHTASVEDLQWSPTEPTVFCSASVDRSLRVWDIRAPPERACQITVPDAHATDVNVISWNRRDTSLIVSGADDGHLKVCDRIIGVPDCGKGSWIFTMPQFVKIFTFSTKKLTTNSSPSREMKVAG